MPRFTVNLFQLFLYLLVLNMLVACGYFHGGSGDQEEPGEQVTPSIALCKTETREILKKFCGECHQKSISRVPRALNVYDLEEDVWYNRMSKSQLKGIKKRIRKADTITKSEIKTVNACINCLLSENCR